MDNLRMPDNPLKIRMKQPFELDTSPEGPLTAARSIACTMAYRKILLVSRS